jgi:hypothetical protein
MPAHIGGRLHGGPADGRGEYFFLNRKESHVMAKSGCCTFTSSGFSIETGGWITTRVIKKLLKELAEINLDPVKF